MAEQIRSQTQLVIAIDGPSGSGKSSTSRGVAERLGLQYLDTGAMYRAITWAVMRSGLDTADTTAVADLVRRTDLTISLDRRAPSFAVDGTDVTTAIRQPEVSAAVSGVATNLEVRAELVRRQQLIVAEARPGIVAEGRDITTVVAPDADLRLLLVADPQARVGRRAAELDGRADRAAVTDQVLRRDRDDSTVATFTEAAEGVTVIDSTHLTLNEVINQICGLAEELR
ncbi:MAG: (d)CMP kinase [Propionibacteriales bacterium]|nr:(d)CMP kinase [Propionibacteriales bacterium]